MISYKLVYIKPCRRKRSVEYTVGGGMYESWHGEVPESMEIHFYTTRTRMTKGFFGIGAREYTATLWQNEQRMHIPRNNDEERDSWLTRVTRLANAAVCELEAAQAFARKVERYNEGMA